MNRILTNKTHLIALLFTVFTRALYAQGLVENTLTTNQVLVNTSQQLKTSNQLRQSSIADTISLDTIKGILDDFSYNAAYPDTAVWLNKQVYVNRTYAKAPITIGVATFDGLNENGYPYNFVALPTSSVSSDTLTSKPINLLNYVNSGTTVNYQPSDSLYFSFYYQPQGLGNSPETADSLVLEFTAPGLTSWKPIWATPGTSLASTDSSWTLVMIPIKSTQYLKKGFQFRFRNYATVSGNLDHWHIDYVYLNKFRNRADTIFEDVAFVYNTPSLINTYTSMPWKHYTTEKMKTVYNTTIRNNFNTQKNVSYRYRVYDDTGVLVNTEYFGGSENVFPYASIGYPSIPPITAPVLNYVIPTLSDTTHYIIESRLFASPDKQRQNDTVRYKQVFHNYYAYDDGTAETAFGLSTLNAQMAVKYESAIDDTLRCIDIYFNPVMTDATDYAFSLNVWSDAAGSPGTAIFTSDSVLIPEYAQTGYDKFTHYYLDPPLFVPAGTFYVGFTQKTNQFLNVGVDRNINTQSTIFYNVAGPWNTSPFPGSLMMHPVFGVADFYLGVEQPIIAKQNSDFVIYPNPASDELFIGNSNPSVQINYSVMDVSGRTVLNGNIAAYNAVNIATLAEGVYFIRLIEGNSVTTIKFIKTF
ncbi:MAG: T9SS type A sorting domain-containing protein [Bacteroidia bacterium]